MSIYITQLRLKSSLTLLKIVALCIAIIFYNSAAATVIHKKATVLIASGTYIGEKGEADFSYDDAKANCSGQEAIDGIRITFHILGQTVTGKPKIILNNCMFKDLSWGGSIKNPEGESFNFGFNGGFQRYQFNRPEEQFVTHGDSYFAYLFPDTYVDGAGIIQYSDEN